MRRRWEIKGKLIRTDIQYESLVFIHHFHIYVFATPLNINYIRHTKEIETENLFSL